MSAPQFVLLAVTGLLAVGSGMAWIRGRYGLALGLLMVAAFALRLLMASLDPFLHEWDERYHALVAKHMIADPLQPLLRDRAYLPYDYKRWGGNMVWLHKQPLFLWQMALSMSLFGVNELALRLPSALLTSLLLYPVYRLGYLLFASRDTAYLGAVLVAFAYFQLELVSGYIGMDHNDAAFLVYVTASIWAYYEYRAATQRQVAWLVAVGVLAGAAVLCKWLTGLLVYAGWGIALLLDPVRRRAFAEYVRLAASAGVAVLVFLPWQLYTAWRFPLESAYERAYNTRHFFEKLEGNDVPWYYHFTMLPVHYGVMLGLVVVGIVWVLRRGFRLVEIFSIVGVALVFFTLAATKMFTYLYVISPLLLLLAAVPLGAAAAWVRARSGQARPATLIVGLLGLIWLDARPLAIYNRHFQEEYFPMMRGSIGRARYLNNTAIYRTLDANVPPGYVVFNAPDGDEIAAMFHCNRPVYAWWPSEAELATLQAQGMRVAVFPDRPDRVVPDYVRQSPGAILLWGNPR
ncbi:ArnT family glycosyltransferase [Hymenobacter daecheongensis]|uniref:ArnT family glycosyltransferase n=1 Tax=Hymenobacter daecheongensis TaxID=496053 RepID=UPI001356677D|nr:glycosyltransferase family 39 protein [Hymenobacter daecheongensis]